MLSKGLSNAFIELIEDIDCDIYINKLLFLI